MDIGIIGGADGPTKIFVASEFSWLAVAIIAIVCIAVLGLIIWMVKKHKRYK